MGNISEFLYRPHFTLSLFARFVKLSKLTGFVILFGQFMQYTGYVEV